MKKKSNDLVEWQPCKVTLFLSIIPSSLNVLHGPIFRLKRFAVFSIPPETLLDISLHFSALVYSK